MTGKPPSRSLATAYRLASEAASAAIAMVMPGLGGWWADSSWGTTPLLTTVGFAIGLVYGIWRLSRLSAPPTSGQNDT